MHLALLEAATLLLAADGEPELDQMYAAAHEVALELRRLTQKFVVFVGRAESHHAFDAGAVVPAAIEQDDLAGGRQMLNVALEIPLSALDVARLLERHHPCAARVEMLHESLDGAALAGGVATLEQDHQALPSGLGPGLQLEQLGLQDELLLLVVAPQHLEFVWITMPPVVGECVAGSLQAAVAPWRIRRRNVRPSGGLAGSGCRQ